MLSWDEEVTSARPEMDSTQAHGKTAVQGGVSASQSHSAAPQPAAQQPSTATADPAPDVVQRRVNAADKRIINGH